jgi:hypothetical protein
VTKILILVCALSTPIEDCTPQTAVSMARQTSEWTVTMCGLFGQAQIAPSAIAPNGDEYVKVVCSTSDGGSAVLSK